MSLTDPLEERRDVIRTPDQRLRVFVSSTLDELASERAAVRAAIDRLRLAPVMFELGARPHPPRALYRASLEQSHIFIGLYWQSYGWIALVLLDGDLLEACGSDAEIDTSEDALPPCVEIDGQEPVLERVAQEGGVEVDLLVVDELVVAAGATVAARGARPLLVLATGKVVIEGTLSAVASHDLSFVTKRPGAGGAVAGYPDGIGQGRGLGSAGAAAGGASHCGRGGIGGALYSEPGDGGSPYGNEELRPLLAGSSGGSSTSVPAGNPGGGYGGGAIQISSAISISIGAGAVVNVGGSGAIRAASGGGSGGALLLEAPEISVAGVLAANGGAGETSYYFGSDTPAESGLAGSSPAKGGFSLEPEHPSLPGAPGGAGDAPAGGDGVAATAVDLDWNYEGSGAGGGVGRIRINTLRGAATIAGAISPSVATGCFSEGTLLPRE